MYTFALKYICRSVWVGGLSFRNKLLGNFEDGQERQSIQTRRSR
jgi:hypothetical protein